MKRSSIFHKVSWLALIMGGWLLIHSHAHADTVRQHEFVPTLETAKSVLLLGYDYYVRVQACHTVRQGYLVVWINDVEMDRARRAVKALEQVYTKQYLSIDTTALFQQAAHLASMNIQVAGGVDVNYCHNAFEQLMAAWNTYVGNTDYTAKKDF